MTPSRIRRVLAAAIAATLMLVLPSSRALADSGPLPQLQVSANGRFLVSSDGHPFFWQADTGWELFHRLSRSEAALYLDDRASKDFNVVQAVALSELDGLNTPNAQGDLPFIDHDPARPAVTPGSDPSDAQQYDYWDHVDWIVQQANRRGIYVAMLPTWGRWVLDGTVNMANAESYGRFLGERYKHAGIVWVLGGDRPATGYENVWRALAKGIAIGVSGSEDYGKVLMSYHPPGGSSSSAFFPQTEPWLDFNMRQDGHCTAAESQTWARIASDYARTPAKPVLDGEPLYESHPICFDPDNRGFSSDWQPRQYWYSDVFAGGFGETYGDHAVWQMYAPPHDPVNRPQSTWYEAIHDPGSGELQYLHRLIDARPFLARIPDEDMVETQPVCATRDHVLVTRDRAGTYALAYSLTGRPFTLDLGRLSAKRLDVAWMNPRTGEYARDGHVRARGTRAFVPPTSGPGQDWVLVLDDSRAHYRYPGPVVRLPRTAARRPARAAQVGPAGSVYRAYDLNGPAVTIDGVPFADERQSSDICAEGPRFANQSVPLDPPTDDARATMIRSSVYNAHVTLLDVPPARYDVYVYVWEDNARQDYTLNVDGQPVAEVDSGDAGHWERLGPFPTGAPDGLVRIDTEGGDANLSGVELRVAG
jgi:Protein of unknown function (DUF4038)/Putative collagen-binding domain of a collagenase